MDTIQRKPRVCLPTGLDLMDRNSSMLPLAECDEPIFILGILQRSGTNYLSDLIGIHPNCTKPKNIFEDFLLSQIDRLLEYANEVSQHWNTKWGIEGGDRLLRQHISMGLISFLNANRKEPDRRLVTKTPSVKNISHFLDIFENGQLVVLVRDGQAVVESGMKSFGWDFDEAAINWAKAASTISVFCQRHGESGPRHILVRYEDLYRKQDEELTRILSFLNLELETYDYDRARNLPIRGSSSLVDKGEAAVHWEAQKRHADFDPVNRSSHWNKHQRARFAWLAGSAAEKLGYEVATGLLQRQSWIVWNRASDIRFAFRWRIRKLNNWLEKLVQCKETKTK